MNRRPPRTTRTDTPFPSTTPFRSAHGQPQSGLDLRRSRRVQQDVVHAPVGGDGRETALGDDEDQRTAGSGGPQQLTERADLREVARSEEHTSELQSLMRISYAVFCLKKKKNNKNNAARDPRT